MLVYKPDHEQSKKEVRQELMINRSALRREGVQLRSGLLSLATVVE